ATVVLLDDDAQRARVEPVSDRGRLRRGRRQELRGHLRMRDAQHDLVALALERDLGTRAGIADRNGMPDEIRDYLVQRAVVARYGRAFGAECRVEMHAVGLDRRPRGLDRVQNNSREIDGLQAGTTLAQAQRELLLLQRPHARIEPVT